jgi:hypothetical protein
MIVAAAGRACYDGDFPVFFEHLSNRSMTFSLRCPLVTPTILLAFLIPLTFGCGASAAPPADVNSETASPPAPATDTASADDSPLEQTSDQAPRVPADTVAESNTDDVASPETSAHEGATLAGRVTLDGPAPERLAINMEKDPTCIKLHGDEPVLSEELLVGEDGGVRNVFVYIRKGAPKKDYPVPSEIVKLDQKGCMYRPRVQGMMAGQTLQVLNSDPVTHNVRSFPIRNRAFNFGQPADSGPRERLFDAPEREIEIQCDIHRWMHAYLFVMDNPFFAVTDERGAYSIEGLPPGEYSLAIWHETLGKQQQDVKVGEVNVDDVNFTFKP